MHDVVHQLHPGKFALGMTAPHPDLFLQNGYGCRGLHDHYRLGFSLFPWPLDYYDSHSKDKTHDNNEFGNNTTANSNTNSGDEQKQFEHDKI